ncbi:MAG: DUF1737 domain-containing protein [Rhizobium sp.]|nr:DUF1737 domain-containing protein [Rhizobium sp.]
MKVYRFITGPDDASFCHRITAALNNGWELSGSPSLTFNTETRQVVAGQAVVKDVPGKDYDPGMKLSEQ